MPGFILETGQELERVEVFQQDDGWYCAFSSGPGELFMAVPVGPYATAQEAYNDAARIYDDLPKWDELIRRNIVD